MEFIGLSMNLSAQGVNFKIVFDFLCFVGELFGLVSFIYVLIDVEFWFSRNGCYEDN